MKIFHSRGTKTILLSTLVFLFYNPCRADINAVTGLECSEADNSTAEGFFQTNLNNLLDLLATNVPLHSGFYKSTKGKSSQKIYGLIQCRGDVSNSDCANCTKESMKVALHECPQSRRVKIWLTWCFLRYTNENFFGVLEQSSVARTNDTNFDEADVVSKGFSFMNQLAITAPKQRLMFQTAVLDAGQSRKRYGMAQCNRDISRSDCEQCLSGQMVTFRTIVGNKRGWEIYGSSCSMWYHDFQFYSNISTPANHGGRVVELDGRVVVGAATAMIWLLRFS